MLAQIETNNKTNKTLENNGTLPKKALTQDQIVVKIMHMISTCLVRSPSRNQVPHGFDQVAGRTV